MCGCKKEGWDCLGVINRLEKNRVVDSIGKGLRLRENSRLLRSPFLQPVPQFSVCETRKIDDWGLAGSGHLSPQPPARSPSHPGTAQLAAW